MKHTLIVEAYYGGAWHDVTAAEQVLISTIMTLKRGAASQTRKLAGGEARFCLDDTGGQWNPYNPTSPIYGLAGRCTPVRISVDGHQCWSGEVAEYQPGRAVGRVRRTEVTGGGILRRLGIGASPVTTALTSSILAANPAIYLPLTDGPLATVAGSPVALAPQQEFAGVQWSKVDGPTADTRKLPQLVTDGIGGDAAWSAYLAETSQTWAIDLSVRAARKQSVFNNFNVLQWTTGVVDTANQASWQLICTWSGNTADPDDVEVFVFDVFDTSYLQISTTAVRLLDDQWHQVRVSGVRSGSNTTVTLQVDGSVVAANYAALQGGGVTQVDVVPSNAGVLTSASIGHIAVYSGSPSDTYDGWLGHPGELASSRFTRLCADAGVSASVIGTGAADLGSHPMGPQQAGTLLDQLQEIVSTDGGLLYEAAGSSTLVLRTLRSLYRQTPVAVDIRTDVVPPLVGVIGDRAIRNDVTAKRASGSSARVTLSEGSLSTAAPPAGVGTYDTTLTVNPSSDLDLSNFAAWLIANSTIDAIAYPDITLNLDAGSSIDASSIEIGSLIELVGLEPIDDPASPRLVVVAMGDKVKTHRRTLALTTVPADVLADVGKYDDSSTRYGTAGSTLHSGVAAGDVTWSVDTSTGPLWSTTATPYDWWVSGERVRVTSMAGATSPQTATVVRSVNGVRKSQVVGEDIQLYRPSRWGM